MLICPQCQFDNPDNNKFCQNCGKSLSFKICPQCSDRVAVNQYECDNCGTKTGVVWRAIIAQVLNRNTLAVTNDVEISETTEDSTVNNAEVRQIEASTDPEVNNNDAEVRQIEASTVNDAEVSRTIEARITNYELRITNYEVNDAQIPLTVGSYLDPQQRYQVIELLPQLDPNQWQCKVLDCQPFQISLIRADTSGKIELPELAKTYITLHSQLGEKIPTVHEAWQLDNKQIVLISDRSFDRQISEAWHDNQTTPVQIWQWLSDMTELWAVLTPWNLRRSVLELANVQVNAKGVLGLQCLYVEATDRTLTLQNLGSVWQQLFQESQRTKVGALVDLLADLHLGKIEVVEDLRSRLEIVANELQAAGITPPVSSVDSGSPQADITTSYQPAPTILQTNESPSTFMQIDDTPTIVLPMQLVSLDDAGLTDVGGQRQHNEDCFGIETAINKLEFPKGRNIQARGLYILCDGMGGHAGGEVASSMAVRTLQQYFQTHWQSSQLPSEESIREAVQLANKAIYDANQQDSRSGVGRMGTTLVLVLLQDNQVAVAHVGDSRLYRLSRKQGLEQVTLDHEVGQREILRGVEPAIAYARPDAYQLTQALGPRDENYIHPDVQFLELNEDTLLVLASDGLSDNNLIEHYWQTHLDPLLSSSSNLEQGVNALIDLANQYNGHDNITAVVIRAKVAPKQQAPQV
ncbi:serine/threonine phosphatase [Aliterella atlantica]|uniref:Serine/threonine protein phosphatase n=1 Tax=Aliterella atlantica CENA595 TaxID=1618023 RepID=A0A0D8ZRS2_9CYAN|nr:serine/threonine phosphatase [Aliterella atlantica]KJH71508.1 serine/threonine protein phosphatase [Aliterella atlantica CENA595]